MPPVNGDPAELRRLDLPIYPKAFIASARLNKERDRVFVIMPFEAPHSAQLWNILRLTTQILDLNVRRVDDRVLPNPIVGDILEEIERAEIIVADLAGLNANCLYEVGIAHARSDSVVLLCPQGQSLPFDLAAIRCIFYDLETPEGRRELTDRLTKTLQALRSVGPPTVIMSRMERTKTIIRDLNQLGSLADEELVKERVWFSGASSAFGIDEDEDFGPQEQPYKEALLQEKEALLSLARRGCSIRCIITPPGLRLAVHRIDVWKHRLRCLLQFLSSNDRVLDNIEFVVSPFRQKSLYIIGHICCLEGYKKGNQRGFSLNLRQTELNAIRGNISLYEVLFEHLEQFTLGEYDARMEGFRSPLQSATADCIQQALDWCESAADSDS